MIEENFQQRFIQWLYFIFHPFRSIPINKQLKILATISTKYQNSLPDEVV